MQDIITLDGPDFLEHYGDVECGSDRLINGAEFHRRALQWKQDRDRLAQAEQRAQAAAGEVERLRAAVSDALSHIAKAA